MAKDLYVPVSIRGGRLEVKAQLGQTVIVTEGPEKYTPAPITPSESQQTIPTKDKQLTADVVVEPIPAEYIIPTGTEEITVTENGTVSRDVSAKETVTVNTNVPIPPGYIIPTGDLGITENGQYDITEKASVTVDVPAPVPTGTKEISIMENGEKTVDVSGFAFAHILTSVPVPQGGLEYEAGTYTPESNGLKTIPFVDSHETAPKIVLLMDTDPLAGNISRITSYGYIDAAGLFGSPLIYSASSTWDKVRTFTRIHSNGNVTQGIGTGAQDSVTKDGFQPQTGTTTFVLQAGQTYKWIAIWS